MNSHRNCDEVDLIFRGWSDGPKRVVIADDSVDEYKNVAFAQCETVREAKRLFSALIPTSHCYILDFHPENAKLIAKQFPLFDIRCALDWNTRIY
jgi:hypothetical protein